MPHYQNAIAVVILAGLAGCRPAYRHDNVFVIPKGYTGIVEVEYAVKGSPQLPMRDESYLITVPVDGHLSTSTQFEGGWAADRYYYGEVGEKSRIDDGTSGRTAPGAKLIWGGAVSQVNEGPHRLTIFVGSKQQLAEYERKHPEFSH